ncbi:serine O-acetyltransferase [Aeromicrobium fastidiosum]|nr:serine acetyltransferase [Aeromicrobium fastidiosum]MBP2390369.1 serine O-acetyltransferase [Aeromicrobium fastidiosum]
MSSLTTSEGLGFRDLVFSDLVRYRPDEKPTWRGVAVRCLSNPGMIASLVLRGQQMAYRRGRIRTAFLLRTVGMLLVSADFVPGMDIGPGLLMPHPNGVVIGNGLVVGANVTFGGGVTAGERQADRPGGGYPTICDGAIVLANAVLVGPVTVGAHAQVGANSVLLSDAPDHAVMFGVPARRISEREGIIPGAQAMPVTDESAGA